MVFLVLMLAVMLAAVCAVAVIGWRMTEEGPASSAKRSLDDAAERQRAREAHYMHNFWSYDGTQQEDWRGE